MATSGAVRILEKTRVFPPSGSLAETSLPLTFFDIIWIHSHPVERTIFFSFSPSPSEFMNIIIPNLKFSLSLTLQQFYPLASELRRSPDFDNKFEIHYKDGGSVSFSVAESEADYQYISGNHSRDFAEVYTLVPKLENSNNSTPLLAIQVTLFPNSGISIGTALHHVAGDGHSYMQFMESWALRFRLGCFASQDLPPPLFDRSVIPDPHDFCSIFFQDLHSSPSNQGPGSSHQFVISDSAVCATFTLHPKQIQRLKRSALAKASERNESFHCSTYTTACAYAWVCLVKAQEYPKGKKAFFVSSVDCRGRLQPPAPATYLGNCIGPCFVEEDVELLVGDDGFLHASEAIGRAVEGLRDDILKGAEGWVKRSSAWVASGRFLSTAGSPKLGVYSIDYGWGRPAKVEVLSIQKTGAIAIAESRDEQGGIEIGLVLPKAVMDEFCSLFYSGLVLPS